MFLSENYGGLFVMKKNIGKIIAVILVVALLTTVLAACNAESYQKKLEKKGYSVVTAENNDENAAIAWTVTATGDGGVVVITKYNNVDDAKEAEANGLTLSVGGVKKVIKRQGKIVFSGTEQAVKDAM